MEGIFTKQEKLIFALMLFMLAALIWGLRYNVAVEQQKFAAIFANGIKSVIEFGEKLFPPTVNRYSLELHTLGNNDTITVNRQTHTVSSKRNFIYHYKGYTVKCTVSYDGNNSYLISCGLE